MFRQVRPSDVSQIGIWFDPSIAHLVSSGQRHFSPSRLTGEEHTGNKEWPVLAAPVFMSRVAEMERPDTRRAHGECPRPGASLDDLALQPILVGAKQGQLVARPKVLLGADPD